MNWLAALIVVCAAAGTACMLVPDESSAGARMLKTLAALCVLSVAVAPLWTARDRVYAVIDSFERFIDSASHDDGEGHASTTESAVARGLADAIAASVCKEFSLSDERVSVAAAVDSQNDAAPQLVSSRVSIKSSDITPDPAKVEKFVGEMTGVPCDVVILAP